MKRLGSPDEVAAAIFYLCSEQASYITGADIPAEHAHYVMHAHLETGGGTLLPTDEEAARLEEDGVRKSGCGCA